MKELLAERDFRFLLGSQILNQAGDGMAQAIFADALVLEPLGAGTPKRVFFLFVVTLVPYSLLSPFLGVFVDRWTRRGLLVWTNIVRAALMVTLPLWARLLPGDSALFVAVLALLGLGRLFSTTKGAALPVVVHEHHLLQANSVSGAGGMIAALGGAVVGVAAVGVVSADVAFFLTAAVYGGGALLARRISSALKHERGPTEGLGAAAGMVARELWVGSLLIWSRPRARLPLAGIFLLRTLAMLVAIAAILVIKTEFAGESERVGRLTASAAALAAAGIGAFAGAVTAPYLGRLINKPGLIVLGFVVVGTGVVGLGGLVSIPAVLALTFLGGYGSLVTKVATDASLQEALPDEFRGRAFALYDILYNMASVAAGAVLLAFQGVDLRPLLIGSGLASLAAAAVVGTAMRRAGMMTETADG